MKIIVGEISKKSMGRQAFSDMQSPQAISARTLQRWFYFRSKMSFNFRVFSKRFLILYYLDEFRNSKNITKFTAPTVICTKMKSPPFG